MENLLVVLAGLIPIIGGVVLFTIGNILANHFDSLLLLFTQKPLTEDLSANPGIKKVKDLIRTIGILNEIIGFAAIIYGLVIIVVGISQLL